MEIWITYSIVGDDNILFWRLNITVDRHQSFLVLTEQEEEDSPVLKKVHFERYGKSHQRNAKVRRQMHNCPVAVRIHDRVGSNNPIKSSNIYW